jgi:hypothetical protein
VERSIEETFTPMQLANERVGVLRLLIDEREGEASNFLKVPMVGENIGVVKGCSVRGDETILPP